MSENIAYQLYWTAREFWGCAQKRCRFGGMQLKIEMNLMDKDSLIIKP